MIDVPARPGVASAELVEELAEMPGLVRLPRTQLVRRTGLVNRLRAERAPVVLLAAPAGYGKTTLLAQWAARDRRAFAWCPLGPGGVGPAALLHLLADSIARASSRGKSRRAHPEPPDLRLALRRLERLLRAHPEPVVLVLDNVEELREPVSCELLAFLLDRLPERWQVVLSGRRPPELPFARLRAEGRLAELSEVELALSDREARLLLDSAGLELDDADVAELNRRVEGWVTGLRLCALALTSGHGPVPRSVEDWSGADHLLAEYFDSEVLSRLEPDDAALLTYASLLDELGGPVCDAVLELEGSGARLKELAARGIFLVPLDAEHDWFRLHTLLREALRRRLEQEETATFVRLSRRAAAWYEHAGEPAVAVGHLLAIGDRTTAAELLGRSVPDVFARGLLVELEPHLAELDAEPLLRSQQPAAVAGALAHALLGRAAEAERWAAAAERAQPVEPARDGTPSSETWAGILRAALCRDGVERMREDAVAAAAEVAPVSPMHACAVLLAGTAQLLGGDGEGGERALVRASELAAATGAPVPEALALAELSLLAQNRESWALAEELARDARDLAEQIDRRHAASALVYAASARSALRNSNWVRAGEDIERVHGLLPRLTEALPWLAVWTRLELARAHLALNDVSAADELSAEIDRLLLARPHLGTLRAEALALRERVAALRQRGSGPSVSLTAAELRLLPLLVTHFTFRQIAAQLYVSRNTIKTQAISVYRKLGVSSRTEAIERAVALGLLRAPDDPGLGD